MSADNWGVCPRCLIRARQNKELLEAQAREAYGVLPVDEFDDLRRRADQPIDEEKLRTLREDYEFFVTTTGEFHAVYGCGCAACGLAHEFRHQEQLAL